MSTKEELIKILSSTCCSENSLEKIKYIKCDGKPPVVKANGKPNKNLEE